MTEQASAHQVLLDLTCLLPVYHRDDPVLLSDALESIARNTHWPKIVLVCEDGPLTKALDEVLSKWSALLPLKRLRSSNSRGLHHNLNSALAHVDTAWICRADADDLNHPDRFSVQHAFAEAHPELDAFGCDILEREPDGALRVKRMVSDPQEIRRLACFRNPINHMTAWVRTARLRQVGGYPALTKKEDYALWLSILAVGGTLGNVPRALVTATLGQGFYGRRAGLHNLATELKLAGLKLGVPGMSRAAVVIALVGRLAALVGSARIASVIYRRVLR